MEVIALNAIYTVTFRVYTLFKLVVIEIIRIRSIIYQNNVYYSCILIKLLLITKTVPALLSSIARI